MKRFTISIFFISFFFFACSESNSSSANESEKENSEPQESVLETFTDERDGQEYKYIKIGNQIWMAENLNYETEDSYCYDDASANCEKYGSLYAWELALEVCPDYWHLPSKMEFELLMKNVGGETIAGQMLKSKADWYTIRGNGTDDFKFSAFPAGMRNSDGSFEDISRNASFWTETESEEDEYMAYYLVLDYSVESAYLRYHYKGNARSVRCVKDN